MNALPGDQSTLAIIVPEAEALVGPFREVHDPAAQAGIPAHVTVLFPFRHPSRIDQGQLETLATLFAAHPSFGFQLAQLQFFPGVMWLRPDPTAPFKALTQAITEVFPDAQPYGGIYDEVLPHLTVADGLSADALSAVEARFRAAAAGVLPLHGFAREVALFTREGTAWSQVLSFPLGRAPERSADLRS